SLCVRAIIRIASTRRTVVLFAPKVGYLYVLDRVNGKFLGAYPMSEFAKNWAKEFASDGRPVTLPEDGTTCIPDINGAANYWPPSYDSSLALLFVTIHDTWQIFNPGTPGGISGVPGSFSVGGPGSAALRAFDPVTGKQKWEYRFPPSIFGLTGVSPARIARGIGLSGGITTTASSLLFTGDSEGNFIAFDSRTGKPLWHYQTGSPVWGSAPVTYMLDGRQHVLIASGMTLTDFALR